PENVALRAHSGVCFILFFAMPAGGDEIHIGLHRKARGRKDSVTAQREIARKAGRFDDFQPSFDPAWLCAVAVVIGNPLAPGKSERRIFSARENRGVFDGNSVLVEVAVECPGLKLTAGELVVMHEQMKWVFVVIALFANGMEASGELGFGKGRPFESACHWHGHSSNSMPS